MANMIAVSLRCIFILSSPTTAWRPRSSKWRGIHRLQGEAIFGAAAAVGVEDFDPDKKWTCPWRAGNPHRDSGLVIRSGGDDRRVWVTRLVDVIGKFGR